MDTTLCTVCGAPIERKAIGRPRLTCSDGCRQERFRRSRGIMNIRYAVPVWDEAAQAFLTRWYEPDHSSGIIDGATEREDEDGASASVLQAVSTPAMSGHGTYTDVLYDQCLKLIELYKAIFDTPEEHERITEAAKAWLRAPDVLGRGLPVPPLHHYLNVVVRDLKREARA